MAEADVPDDVAFDYLLTGVGWSEARLRIGVASTSLSASYLDDALGDLLRATAVLDRARSTVRVSWADEPGEFRWVLDRSGDNLTVRVLWFGSLWGRHPDESGEVLLDASTSVGAFRRAIAAGAKAVLDECGEDGYRAKWARHGFPTSALRELARTL